MKLAFLNFLKWHTSTKFPHVSRMLRTFCIDANTQNKDKFLMQFTEKFIEAGLIEDAFSLVPKNVEHFLSIELNDSSEKLTLQETPASTFFSRSYCKESTPLGRTIIRCTKYFQFE